MSFNYSSFVAAITKKYNTAIDKAMSATVDYFTLTAMEEPSQLGKMPWDAEFHYFINNQLNGLWNAMYGNTVDTVGLDRAPETMPRDLAWKPVHVLARAEAALNAYKSRRTYCDESREDFDPEAAANDLTFLRLATRVERAQSLLDMFRAEFEAKKELYEGLFEQAWVYKPYTVRGEGSTDTGTMTDAQKAAAARFRAMKARGTQEAPGEAA